ncbi:hypothetical protein AK812_SmicGene15951 [Symbiodinium microadriaticum]|uniref:Uncharacterized protein n=1 Tax=Symbiodinium microadriaticum TaxID=2951 RepID=A0A1Q9E1I4_SYMMI|nr:hypothetical protein AK812_SmicGene15951 [Symbiodinium microadriaticum]
MTRSVHPRALQSKPRPRCIRRALPCEWKNFREHHYKDPSLHPCAVCFVGVLGAPLLCLAHSLMEVPALQLHVLALGLSLVVA